MKKLTLQINKACFENILNGTQKVEHRYVYPSNQKMYVQFKCNGVIYDNDDDLPDDGEVDVIPRDYDVLYLINGRRKDAPRLTVEIVKAEFVVMTDEEGNDITYIENGIEYFACQVWYHLGKVINTENV